MLINKKYVEEKRKEVHDFFGKYLPNTISKELKELEELIEELLNIILKLLDAKEIK